MKAGDALRLFVAPRVTVAILAALAALLLLLVVVPQAAVVGEGAFAALAGASRLNRFVLEDLALGRLPTSPIFLATLSLFFLNLGAVLIARLGPTWRRVRLRPPSGAGVEAWARLEESRTGSTPDAWSLTHAAETLRGFGYEVRRPSERSLWGVKHRSAPLGFLLFHLSFFLLCAGGVLVYYTRFEGSALATEGQTLTPGDLSITRRPPVGGPPELAFVVEQVEPRVERGEAVHLGASFRVLQAGGGGVLRARVNAPARWGAVSLLVTDAGLSPALWLQDEQGFTLDRVVVPVRRRAGGLPTEAALAGGRWKVWIHPLAGDLAFPDREALPRTPLRVEVRPRGEPAAVFDGLLRQGDAAALGGDRLVLEEMRYWVSVSVVSERGGGLLVAGFAIGIVGVTWRLLLYRREVALSWDAATFRLVGRSEYFSREFQAELDAIQGVLRRVPDGDAAREAAEARPAEARKT